MVFSLDEVQIMNDFFAKGHLNASNLVMFQFLLELWDEAIVKMYML